MSGLDPSRMERRRQFLLDWFGGEKGGFVDRDGSWTIPGFLAEMDWIDVHALRELIKARFAVKGQPTRFASDVGLCDETILSFLRGARPPADDLLASLGWERQTFYRKVDPCACYRCTSARVRREPQNGGIFGDLRLMRMWLCETCGNKRCPHGTDHRLACTNSNSPGQAGSLYEDAPTPPCVRDSDPKGEDAKRLSAKHRRTAPRRGSNAQVIPQPGDNQ